jgi:hypothetical protein
VNVPNCKGEQVFHQTDPRAKARFMTRLMRPAPEKYIFGIYSIICKFLRASFESIG